MSHPHSSVVDPRDRAVLDAWWAEFVATGALPKALTYVQGRLIRAVGRGELPSGPVFVKVMSFPRGKDRLRYALRPLPSANEATWLRGMPYAKVLAPEVVDVRVLRRFGLPFRSMLVLRALPVVPEQGRTPEQILADQAAIAHRLLDFGLWHRDLHPDNFVRLADGKLALLDLQSLQWYAAPITMHGRQPALARGGGSVRAGRDMAARLLAEAVDVPVEAAIAILVDAGLVAAGDVQLVARAQTVCLQFLRKRALRCLATTTEFRRRGRWWGECRLRAAPSEGPWSGGVALRECWLGQRLLQLFERRPPVLGAYAFSPFGARVQWSAPLSASAQATELATLRAAYDRYRWLFCRDSGKSLEELRQIRRQLTGA
jgi:hypothetical protein